MVLVWKPLLILITIGNRKTFIGVNIFVGTDKYILKYIRRYMKPMNIMYIHRLGRGTDKCKWVPV
jgi:hypothetical protein